MIEKTVFDYLKEKLNETVAMSMQDKDSFVLIERAGSGNEDFIDSATIIIQSYGKSIAAAAALNEKVKEKMKDIDELEQISRGKQQTDDNYTDKSMKRNRYQAKYEITKM